MKLIASGAAGKIRVVFIFLFLGNAIASQSISPVLEFVCTKATGRFAAHFGYYNPNASTIDVAIGSENNFHYHNVGGRDLGQPRAFNSGRVVDAFSVPFDGSNLVWNLTGKTATASGGESQGDCSDSSPPPDSNATFQILYERWNGISGSAVNDLTSNPNYPDNPSFTALLASLVGPTNIADSYGTRVRGYFLPPQSGGYVFSVKGDDETQLFVSSDANPENIPLSPTASVPGYTTEDEWEKYPEQTSSSLNLEAGIHYYFELLHKEGGGRDHFAVGWQLPDGNFERPVPGGRLVHFDNGTQIAPVIHSQPESKHVFETQGVTFSVSATGLPYPEFQWYHQGSPISGANSKDLYLAGVIPFNEGDYFVEVSNEVGAPLQSEVATLNVVPLPGPMDPKLFKAFAFGSNDFTREVPNSPSAQYIKIVQGRQFFEYSSGSGQGYVDLTGLDGTSNNRGVFDGPNEIYDQFIGAKGGSSKSITFRIDLPNGKYRFVAAGGDPSHSHGHSIRVKDGEVGTTVWLVNDVVQQSPGEVWSVGFGDHQPPPGDGTGTQPVFLAQPSSEMLDVTQGYIQVIQQPASSSTDGGDLSLLEIWAIEDVTSINDWIRKASEAGGGEKLFVEGLYDGGALGIKGRIKMTIE